MKITNEYMIMRSKKRIQKLCNKLNALCDGVTISNHKASHSIVRSIKKEKEFLKYLESKKII